MTLAQGQASFGGLVFGEGTDLSWGGAVDGLFSMAVDSSPASIVGADGAVASAHRARATSIVWRLLLMREPGASDQDFERRFVEVIDTFTRYETFEGELVVRYSDQEWLHYARVIDRRPHFEAGWVPRGLIGIGVAFERTDPRRYGIEERSVIIPQYLAGGGGVDFDIDFDVEWSAATETLGVAPNAGNAEAFPLLRVERPSGSSGTVTGFSFTVIETGQEVAFEIPLAAGETFEIDMLAVVKRLPAARSGLPHAHIAGSSRYSLWTYPRRALAIPPGGSTIRLDVEGTATDLIASASYRDTSL